jgi:uncharacterized repeat protein (TIGR03803 family)
MMILRLWNLFRLWNLLLVVFICLPRSAEAQSVKVTLIYAFSSVPNLKIPTNTDGSSPQSQLAFGSDGDLYGSTSTGGTNGVGTLFRVTTNGAFTLLGTFSHPDSADRNASLVLAGGTLYGTTASEGVNTNGTIYTVTTNGTVSTLYTFSPLSGSTNSDGAAPEAGLTLGHDGNLYGITTRGGAYGQGTIFKITTNGNLTPLSSFLNNGYSYQIPMVSQLTFGHDGNLYGTSQEDGTNGDGDVFQATTNGGLATFSSFGGPVAGYQPSEGVTLGPDGDFYGTTHNGGTNNNNLGTAYQITPAGAIATLVSFNNTNGAYPAASLTLGSDGALYGSTQYGGTNGANDYFGGTLFRLTTNGAFTPLYSFAGPSNSNYTNALGSQPMSALTQAPDGSFYGTTSKYGPNSSGTIFRLTISPPMTPPPALVIQYYSKNIVLTWNGPTWTLQTAPSLHGTYTNMPSATSPYTNGVAPAGQFFRLIEN